MQVQTSVPDDPPPGGGSWHPEGSGPRGDRVSPRRWTFRAYLGAVVLPLCLGLWAAAYLRAGEVERLRFEEDQRMGEAAMVLLERDLDEARDLLLRRVRPLAGADRELPGVRAALGGDTVISLRESEGGGLEVSLLVPSGGGVAAASAPFSPSFLRVLSEAAGYDAALYLNRGRIAATAPDFGPETLSPGVHRRLVLFPRGAPYELGDRTGSLHPRLDPPGRPPEMSILAAPGVTRPPALSARVPYLAGSLALGMALLGGWGLAARGRVRWRDPWRRIRMVLLVWAPLLVVMGALLVLARTFPNEARRATVQELARAMAIARSEWERLTPEGVEDITGFPVTLLGDDGVEHSTLKGGLVLEELEAIERPPSAFAITGRAGSGREEILYVASRLSPDVTLVLSAPGPQVRLRGLGFRILMLGVGVAFMVVVFPLLSLQHLRRGDRRREDRGLSARGQPVPGLPGDAPLTPRG